MTNNCSLDQLSPYDDYSVIKCSRSKSLLSDITRYLNLPNSQGSKQNVELGLEIEINESVQRVLKEEASSDDLLAVTIIRPSESELVHETTVALNKDDVKEFIALVERHQTKHQLATKKSEKETKKIKKDRHDKEIEKEREKRTSEKERGKEREKAREKPREKERDHKPKEKDRSTTESKDSKLGTKSSYASREVVITKPASKGKGKKQSKPSIKRSNDSKEIVPPNRHSSKVSKVQLSTFGENAKQVYTTINTFDKLKEVLPCQNKHRSEKPGVPCICQNCGIMDVLVQSQKGPVVEFPPLEEVRQPEREKDKKEKHKREKKEKYQHPSVSSTLDIDILKEINARINNLEKRLAIQEETAVSKDYLKHVLHKIFSQYKKD